MSQIIFETLNLPLKNCFDMESPPNLCRTLIQYCVLIYQKISIGHHAYLYEINLFMTKITHISTQNGPDSLYMDTYN